MGSVVQVAVPAAALIVCVVVGSLAARTVRRAAERQARLHEELCRSRDDVEALCRKVDALADDVARSRTRADDDREYVITSFAGAGSVVPERLSAPVPALFSPASRAPHLAARLEDRLLAAAAQAPQALSARGVPLVVRGLALAHGVRRALSPDVLDRAAAEAHLARRRSRRARRRQLRLTRRRAAA